MDIRHVTPHPPNTPKIARPALPTKTIFDKTNPPVDRLRPKTTTYGINCAFRPFSISHKCALSSSISAGSGANDLGYQLSSRRTWLPGGANQLCRVEAGS